MSKKTVKPPQPIVALDPVSFKMLQEEQAKQEFAAEELNKKEPGTYSTAQGGDSGILGQIVKSLQLQERSQVERMAFEIDPKANYQGNTGGYYRLKQGLTPNHILRRIAGPQGCELVCQILQARSNIIAAFGRPRTSRFAIGFEIEEVDVSAIPKDPEGKMALQEKIDKAKKKLWTCGGGELDEEIEHPTFAQYLKLITRDGLLYGSFATEFLWQVDAKTGNRSMYAFRAADSGTINKILPQRKTDQSVRERAIIELQRLKDKKIDIERYEKDEYKWVQVIDGRVLQAFTGDEMVVYNLYPVTNVEYNGYPLSPIDQALNAITTHINITMHNKLYFQNGRAARGMLVFKSDSIDESAVQKIRLQFHQSINSVQSSWRMPVFAVGSEDDVRWEQIDVSGRDAEFQYLMDNNARVILSAFQMSPDELPGMGHLSRGTNTQALSEAQNEWKLLAARDVGLRPLMHDIQDFLNKHIFPKIDAELAKTHQIVLAGLDKDDPEKESTRLQQDMNVHLSYNDILERVEKDPIPAEIGGKIPLNPQFQAAIEKYLTVGEILEYFFDRKGAMQDPRYQYVRDPFWLQYQQFLMSKAQAAMQQQMMVQQQMMQAQMPDQGQPGEDQQAPPQEEQAPPGASSAEKAEITANNLRKKEEWLALNYQSLEKKVKDNHNSLSRLLLERHKELVHKHLEQWKADSKKTLAELADIVDDKKDEE